MSHIARFFLSIFKNIFILLIYWVSHPQVISCFMSLIIVKVITSFIVPKLNLKVTWKWLKIMAVAIDPLFTSHLSQSIFESIKIIATLFIHTQHEPNSNSSDLYVKLTELSTVKPALFRSELFRYPISHLLLSNFDESLLRLSAIFIKLIDVSILVFFGWLSIVSNDRKFAEYGGQMI